MIKNAKFSGYYFYMNTNIQRYFQICISLPLKKKYRHLGTAGIYCFTSRCSPVLIRLVFSRILDLRGNLGIVKEKPARKTCFSREKSPSSMHLPSKILPGGVSWKPTESLLYFHKKQMLKRGRLCLKRFNYKSFIKSFIKKFIKAL